MAQPPYGIPAPVFRLPAETRLGRVVLEIADLDRSMDYYQRVLGLRALQREPGRAVLGPQGDDTAIVELRQVRGARPVPPHGRLGLYHFAILLPDRAALARFLPHLAALGHRPGMSDHLVSEALYLTDPDGLGIEVYADRPRSSWRARERQLVMATEPLDVADLLAAGGGEPWTGAPAGTKLGHVHLHVGDLQRAADFYHRGLGLDQVVWSYPGALFLSAGGYHHHLGVNTWARGVAPASDGDARLVEWEVLLPSAGDTAAALDSLAAAGAGVQRADDGGTARDPWGVGLRLRAAA
ncbi:MAG TPA: VOC family protein [Thermoanaerobaculia bacterium]|jgi:catechol 2,3-dioxygenase|nr:VOC family protein [Thermoanaerobaculia bacterium]